MLLLLTSWLIFYFITAILGFSLLKVSRLASPENVTQTEVVLVGIVAVISIAQLTSLIWPTDFRLAGLLILAAGLLNWRLANRPFRMARTSLDRIIRNPLVWLLAAGILLFAICRVWYFDSGVYHIPSIRWYERFRAIPGLGNLQGRLAFNSSFFVLSAAFGFTDLLGQTQFALNGFMLLLFGTYVLNRVARPEPIPGLRVLQGLLLALALYYLLYAVSSPTPDVWATLLPIFILFFWLDPPSVPDKFQFFLLTGLVLLCLTIKLGTVPLLLFLPLLLVSHRHTLDTRQGLLLLALGGGLIGPWLIRNVILSGYLLYPFPAVDLFTVDWKIPLSAVRHEDDYVVFWSRFHIDEPFMDTAKLRWPISRWLPLWWQEQGNPKTFFYFKLNRPLFIAASVSPLIMAFQGLRSGLPTRLWQAYAVALAGFLFWFIKAPEFRFGLPFIWMVALLPWTPLLGQIPVRKSSRPTQWALALLLVWFSARLLYTKQPLTTRSLLMANWYGYQDVVRNEEVRYRPYRTRSGLVVLTPQANHLEQRCFDIGQPCSPYFIDDLEQRGPGFEAGFRRQPLSSSSTQPHKIISK